MHKQRRETIGAGSEQIFQLSQEHLIKDAFWVTLENAAKGQNNTSRISLKLAFGFISEQPTFKQSTHCQIRLWVIYSKEGGFIFRDIPHPVRPQIGWLPFRAACLHPMIILRPGFRISLWSVRHKADQKASDTLVFS